MAKRVRSGLLVAREHCPPWEQGFEAGPWNPAVSPFLLSELPAAPAQIGSQSDKLRALPSGKPGLPDQAHFYAEPLIHTLKVDTIKVKWRHREIFSARLYQACSTICRQAKLAPHAE